MCEGNRLDVYNQKVYSKSIFAATEPAVKSYVCAKSNSGNNGNARHWASVDFVNPVRR